MNLFSAELLGTAMFLAGPVYYAALGEIFAEKSGVFNFGIEGIMLIGAVSGFITTLYTGDTLFGVLVGILGGALMGLLVAFMAVHLHVNQIVSALGVYLLGLSLSSYMYVVAVPGSAKIQVLRPIPLGPLANLPIIGPLFNQIILVYIMYLLIPTCWYFFTHTLAGLKVRAIGMNPASSDALGVNVILIKYLCLIVSSVLGALGGLTLVMGQTGFWIDNITAGRGFIAVGLIRVGNWTTQWTFVTVFLYGFLSAATLSLPDLFPNIPYEFIYAIPYIVAVASLTVSFKLKLSGQPAALGKPYRRQ